MHMYPHFITYPQHLSVVDHAGPGVSRGRNSRGGVAGNVASDAAEGLDLRASVGRHLDGAGPVPA